MFVAQLKTKRPEMGSTRTYQDFKDFLGTRPEQFGVVSQLYPQLTCTFLTEALGNVWRAGKEKGSVKSLNSFSMEWQVETNEIKKIPMARPAVKKGTDVFFYFGENYYQIDEYFKVETTDELFAVIGRPTRLADNLYEVPVQLMADNFAQIDAFNPENEGANYTTGVLTRFIANRKPEMSDCGQLTTINKASV